MVTEHPPRCKGCGNIIDRVDHSAVEHLILDGDTFRPVHVDDGGIECFGIESEIHLSCGYCQATIPREMRQWFYSKWWKLKEMIEKGQL